MNRTIFLSTAAVIATAFVQPVEAKDKGDGRGGRGGGGGGGKHEAPAKAKGQASARVAPSPGRSFRGSAPRVQGTTRIGRGPAIARSDSARVQGRRSPSVAFGGTSVRNRNVDRDTTIRNINRFNN